MTIYAPAPAATETILLMLTVVPGEWVSLGTIADKLRISPTTAYQYMRLLRKAEPLIEAEIVTRPRFSGGYFRSYRDEARVRRYRFPEAVM